MSLAACQALILLACWPLTEAAREVALSQVWRQESFKNHTFPPRPDYSAQMYCEDWTGETAQAVDCPTGRGLSDMGLRRSAQAQEADERAAAAVQAHRLRYEAISSALQSHQATRPALQQVIIELRRKAASLDAEQSMDARTEPRKTQALQMARPDGLPWFEKLVAAEGLRHVATTGSLLRVGWDVARLSQEPEDIVQRGQQLEWLLRWGAPAWLLFSTLLLGVAWWRAGWLGLACAGTIGLLMALGLGLTVSASSQFGLGILQFAFNPLGNQAVRQALLQVGALGMVILMALTPHLGRAILSALSARPVLLFWLMPASVMAAYYSAGPAIGSETLKASVAVCSAVLVVNAGRITHAARELAPQLLSWRLWLVRDGVVARTLRRRLILPLSAYSLALLVSLGSVAAVFHDLGAVLVSSVIGLATVLLVFGGGWALLLTGAMGAVGLVLLNTNKLQDRLLLMRDPWTAQVSDFARLEAFAAGAPPGGWGVRALPWCSEGGTCLPLQILSDYTPTLLKGALGISPMVAVFILLTVGSTLGAAWMMRHHLTHPGPSRLLSMTAFFLLIATVVQTLLTFFGNWRWIPLTGLGTPLVSIGLSSLAAPMLALGLLLQLKPMARRAEAVR